MSESRDPDRVGGGQDRAGTSPPTPLGAEGGGSQRPSDIREQSSRRPGSDLCRHCGGTGRTAVGSDIGADGRSSWPLDDPVCPECAGEGNIMRA